MNRFSLAVFAILAWYTPYRPTTAIAAEKETPAAALKRARGLLDAGSSQEAMPILDQLIEKNPQNAEAYSWRGRAIAASGNMAKAMADLDRAIELNPRLAQAYVNRAAVWLLSKDEAHGSADLETAIKLDPRNARAYVTRGALHLVHQEYPEALADENKAIQLDPNLAVAFRNMANVKREMHDVNGSLAAAEKGVELAPANPESYAIRAATTWALSKDWRSAIVDYGRAIRLAPQASQAQRAVWYYNRGQIRCQVGDLRAGLPDLNVAVSLDPTSQLFRERRALVRYDLKDTDGSFSDFDRLVEMNPKNPTYYYNRGLAMVQVDRKSLDDFTKAIELKPDLAVAFTRRGYGHLWWGQEEEAHADFAQALKLQPELKDDIDYMTQFAKQFRPHRESPRPPAP